MRDHDLISSLSQDSYGRAEMPLLEKQFVCNNWRNISLQQQGVFLLWKCIAESKKEWLNISWLRDVYDDCNYE